MKKETKRLTRSIVMSFFFYCEVSFLIEYSNVFSSVLYSRLFTIYIQHSVSLIRSCVFMYLFLYFFLFSSYMSSEYRIVCEIKKLKQKKTPKVQGRESNIYIKEKKNHLITHLWSDHHAIVIFYIKDRSELLFLLL